MMMHPKKGEMLLNLLLESKGAKDVVAIILVHESHVELGGSSKLHDLSSATTIWQAL